MEIELTTDDKKGRFFIRKDGVDVAEMTFVYAGDTRIIIDHTVVNPSEEGKGYGKQLVVKGVEFARENNLKIIPLCPFAKRVINQNPQLQDVLIV